ncbi:hypothetical protein [Mesonia sp. HuA40]|uniref:hypothetical protein n=1 Tax=Mesonia sp. HuA40 TaxID=2602761 RepID=UPI0011C87CDA|nr:hypothetical protein [Mesonia sp. HuA40]TXK71711.1 hypothetical protein FT993_08735 [Mesonia sp. HuA40]
MIYCLGNEIEGSLKIVKPGDILLARLDQSMINRKIDVVPSIPQAVDYIVASPEFIVIRSKDLKDSFYITGVLRTDLMLKYMYSKTRCGTPSRYRLNEDDFKELDFPIVDDKEREKKSTNFSKALTKLSQCNSGRRKEFIRISYNHRKWFIMSAHKAIRVCNSHQPSH